MAIKESPKFGLCSKNPYCLNVFRRVIRVLEASKAGNGILIAVASDTARFEVTRKN